MFWYTVELLFKIIKIILDIPMFPLLDQSPITVNDLPNQKGGISFLREGVMHFPLILL